MPGRPIDNSEHRRTKLVKEINDLETALGVVETLLDTLTSRVDLLFIPGEIRSFAMPSPPEGWLEADGAAILIADEEDLAAASYCGDSANGSAAWGYKVTGGGVRDITGTHIVLPDYRGEFLRGWDHGRGKDSGRDLYSAQTHALNSHNHTGTADASGFHTHSGVTSTGGDHVHAYNASSVTTNDNTTVGGNSPRVVTHGFVSSPTSTAGSHSHTLSINGDGQHSHNLTIANTGGTETRPVNLAALICIKT